jgi:integrase
MSGRGSVIKRGGGYSVVLSRGIDPVTKKRLRDWHGPYRTKKEAELARTKLLGAADKGEYVKPEQVTLGEFLTETWLPAIAATVRPTTCALYRQVVKNHLIPGLGSVRLQGLTAPALNKFYATLLATGRRDGTGGLSTRSARIVHTVLHRSLRDALRWRLVSHNVAAEADPPVSHSKEAVTWSGEQTSAFLKSVANDPQAPLFRLTAATGMRRGEICGLRWSDVDLDGASLRVSQTIVEVDRQLAFSEPKTGSSRRTLRLDPVTVKVLRDHHWHQLEQRMALGPLWKGGENNLVFTRPDGSPVPPLWLTRYFARRVKAAGVPPATFHGVRHSYLSGLIRDGQSVRAVSARAGHANATITLNTYSHVLPGDDEQLALAGAARLGG